MSLHHRSRRNALDVVADGDNLNLEDRIEKQGEISGDDDSSESSSSCDSFSSCSSFDSHEDDDRHNKYQIDDMERIVVMTNVPPHQVPDGVINLVRSHRPFI